MRYIWQRSAWPQFTWDSSQLMAPLGRARALQGRLWQQMQAFGLTLHREAQAHILIEETRTTAAIEGEHLSPASIRSSVARQLGLPWVGLPPTERHVDGLVTVLLDATIQFARPLTRQRLRGWHAALFPTGFSGMHQIPTGRWRREDPMQVVSGPIGRERVHFEAPPVKRIDREIQQFLTWWKTSAKTSSLDGILRAGMAHLHFVTIHPFADGNGRLARALTNMALAQDEQWATRSYSVSSQIMANRQAYYDVLEHTQKGGCDITDWLQWFVQTVAGAMHRSQGILEWTIAKAQFWQQHAHIALNDRQRKVINRLLEAGQDGFTGGLTTRKYVALTKTSRATAYRELDDLVAKHLLVPNNTAGRSSSYRLAIPKHDR